MRPCGDNLWSSTLAQFFLYIWHEDENCPLSSFFFTNTHDFIKERRAKLPPVPPCHAEDGQQWPGVPVSRSVSVLSLLSPAAPPPARLSSANNYPGIALTHLHTYTPYTPTHIHTHTQDLHLDWIMFQDINGDHGFLSSQFTFFCLSYLVDMCPRVNCDVKARSYRAATRAFTGGDLIWPAISGQMFIVCVCYMFTFQNLAFHLCCVCSGCCSVREGTGRRAVIEWRVGG